MRKQFELGYDIPRIVSVVQFETGQVVSEGGTLIVLDEVQACPKALTSLKYFCEDAPGYAVAAAGSLLGITVHEGSGYPVGKVNAFDLHPLSFREFLVATGNRALCDLINTGDASLISSFSSRFVPLLRQYYYVGHAGSGERLPRAGSLGGCARGAARYSARLRAVTANLVSTTFANAKRQPRQRGSAISANVNPPIEPTRAAPFLRRQETEEGDRLEERDIMGELNMYRQLGIKPNFGEIARRYCLDRHTVASY